jgi:hypothetical protein
VSGGKNKKAIDESGIITVLSSILASVAPSLREKDEDGLDTDLQSQLLNLCTRDGTPEQAKHAVYTMAALLSTENDTIDETAVYEPVLKALTSPSRMRVTSDKNSRVVSVLAALSALADSAPTLFASGMGSKAVRFALESVLLGRRHSHDGDDGDEGSDSEEEPIVEGRSPTSKKSAAAKSPPKSPGGRKPAGSSKNITPSGKRNSLEDQDLSMPCRRLCAAIEFLATYIRAAIIRQFAKKCESSSLPSSELISQIFGILSQILHDKGLPPSNRDRRFCKSRQDRAALRECAAIHLFRLCYARLQLEQKYLSAGMWHNLSSILLDEERAVRESAMEELSSMLLGQGKYLNDNASAFAPSLRFVAMVVFCPDGDGHTGNSIANGNAANVGKRSVNIKNAARKCIESLRGTCDNTLHQCRAIGREAEKKFDRELKMVFMPEYAVPYALHLLSLRRETPSAGGTAPGVPGLTQLNAEEQANDGDEESYAIDDDSLHKILRKRLKWLLEPLVLSLGDSADNISFLLRMTEVIGNHHQPVDIRSSGERSTLQLSMESEDSFESLGTSPHGPTSPERRNLALSVAKLKTTCLAAREVLLYLVKKDVNLEAYPGKVVVPISLFRKLAMPTVELSQQSEASSSVAEVPISSKPKTPTRDSLESSASSSTSGQKRMRISKSTKPLRDSLDSANSGRKSLESATGLSRRKDSSTKKSRVHFSPELVIGKSRMEDTSPQSDDENDGGVDFGDLSPIESRSPSPAKTTSQKTLGTTPPSALRTAPSTYEEEDGMTDDDEASKDASKSPTPSFGSDGSQKKLLAGRSRSQRSTQDSGTTSETQSSLDTWKPKGDKRKSPAGSRQATKKLRKTKVSVGSTSFGKLSLESTSSTESTARRSSRKRSSETKTKPASRDELDFDDNDLDFPDEDAGSMAEEKENKRRKIAATSRKKSKGVFNRNTKGVVESEEIEVGKTKPAVVRRGNRRTARG